ncbi:MAG: GNAT family N-acetyltransferase [Rhodospirillaceae bacterium]
MTRFMDQGDEAAVYSLIVRHLHGEDPEHLSDGSRDQIDNLARLVALAGKGGAHWFLVAEDERQIVAALMLCRSGRDWQSADLGEQVTHPDWRGRGLQRQLVAHAVKLCQAFGIRSITICSQEPEFHHALGFRKTVETRNTLEMRMEIRPRFSVRVVGRRQV